MAVSHHPLAEQLNVALEQANPHVFEMLSPLGRAMYFPSAGIVSQAAEANTKAKRFNATAGIAMENGAPMHLGVFQQHLSDFNPRDLYTYAPPAGKPDLRKAWREKMLREDSKLLESLISDPIVTNALTHGISLVADLFSGPGTPVVVPDMNWENYDLTFGVRRGATMEYYPLFNDEWRFHSAALRERLLDVHARGATSAVVVLNFPNNPTGYTPSAEEGTLIVQAVRDAAEAGLNVVVVLDDAYYSLFFEDSLKTSLFSQFAGLHPRVLAVKVDGATKEEYVWGFRVGFLTFASEHADVRRALEQKAVGLIRATISSGPHPSQSFVLRALQDPQFEPQRQEKFEIMRGRANRTKTILQSGKYDDVWTPYPFNSGYFMCLKLKGVTAEEVRRRLLDAYQVGTIALGETDLRVAFSCVEEDQLQELFDTLHQAVLDCKGVTTS